VTGHELWLEGAKMDTYCNIKQLGIYISSIFLLLVNLEIGTLQSCTGPVQGQNRVFPVKFSTQGKTCFHFREPLFSLQGPLFSLQGFPCEKTSQGKPCFHYREWVCSAASRPNHTSHRKIDFNEYIQNYLCCDMGMIIFELDGYRGS
jgi:hypothetical protein